MNKTDSVMAERTENSIERSQALQKQMTEIKKRQDSQDNDLKDSLSTLVRQVGRLEGMIEVLVDKSQNRK